MRPYIGTATSRVDGHAKVTGAAKYAAEFNAPGLAHGSVVTSTIAKGRIARIDVSDALRVDGVHRRAHAREPAAHGETPTARTRTMSPRTVRRSGRSTTTESCSTASRSRWSSPRSWRSRSSRRRWSAWTTTQEPHVTDLYRRRDRASALEAPANPAENPFAPPKAARHGRAGIRCSRGAPPGRILCADRASQPDGTLCLDGDHRGRRQAHDLRQDPGRAERSALCLRRARAWSRTDVRVLSPFMGGGFGSGLRPQYQVILAALAARALKRSVRVVLTRQQMYGLGYRPAMIQRIELGAKADGTLDAITHEAITVTSQYEDFYRQETGWSGLLYKCPNAKYAHKLAQLDLADLVRHARARALRPASTRSNARWTSLRWRSSSIRSSFACGAIRIATRSPTGPTAARACASAIARAPKRSAGVKRNPEPRSMRDGSEFVGWGMATGVWEALQMPIAVRIVLTGNGHAEVSCATSDIGTGTYTIMAQVAADMLGLPLDNITIKLGDSTLPQSPVEGGSWIAASVANGIATTSEAVRNDLLRLAKQMPNSPLADAAPDEVTLADGMLVSKQDAARAVSIVDAMRHGGVDRIEQEKTTSFPDDGSHAHNTHSADLRRGQGGRAARRHPRHPRRQRGCGRPHPEHQDREQSDHGRRGVGHRNGAARGNADRSRFRPHHECQYRRISCPGERRRTRTSR